MGLTSALLIGRTALNASQVALQVAGNNISNVGTEGYHRQRVELSPVRGLREGSNLFYGQGVGVDRIKRVIDPALAGRLRSSISQEQGASVERGVLDTIESITNELTGTDLSSQLSRFFNAWSELANNPSSSVTRAAVAEEGSALASYISNLRRDLLQQRQQLEDQLAFSVVRADELVDDIAHLNSAIAQAEAGGAAQDGNLRDQRDLLIDELAGLMDITVVEQPTGSVDILVDSQPIVLGSKSKGLKLDLRSVPAASGGEATLEFRIKTDEGDQVRATDGRIGKLLDARDTAVQGLIEDLDDLSSQLIYQVNTLHSSGRPAAKLTDTTGWQFVETADQVRAFNDPDNETFAALPFQVNNGSFRVIITDGNGNQSEQTIFVDLDGVQADGTPGFADDTTMADIQAALDGVANLHAEITPGGQLRVYTDAGFDVSFGDDSSGVLAVLGINTFFQGTTGLDMALRGEVANDPELISVGHGPGQNTTALSIAQLREAKVSALGGRTLTEQWATAVEGTSVRASAAASRHESLATVRSSLEAQRAALSGVSLDEESINLITFQQQYAGAARFISVVDELTQLLISLV